MQNAMEKPAWADGHLPPGSDVAWSEVEPFVRYIPRDVVLELAVRLSHWVPGNIVEFGVWRGTSTRVLRRSLSQCKFAEFGGPPKKIYACDSFEGLPEKYEKLEPGAFKLAKPPRIRGVRMVKGYFQDSLTPELAAEVKQVALASLDADLYSSTACALKWLTPLLGTGSLLLFDQFLGAEEAEKRAFEDWSRESGVRTVRIGSFAREPAGLGRVLDERALFQVVGTGTIDPVPPFWVWVMKVKRRLGVGFAP
jgi:hypothetical protein